MAVGRHSEGASRLTCAFSSIPIDTKMAEHRGATVGRPAVMANPLLVDGRGLSFTHLRLE
jgi:hypothetical protein